MAETTPAPGRPIVVAGDITIDWLAWPRPAAADDGRIASWQRAAGTLMVARRGGALLLADLLKAATSRPVISPRLRRAPELVSPQRHIHSNVDLEEKKEKKKDEEEERKDDGKAGPEKPKPKPKTFRVARLRGYCGPASGKVAPLQVDPPPGPAQVLVLDDAANGFRDDGATPALIDAARPDWLIVKMARPLARKSPLWDLARRGPLRRAGETPPDGTPSPAGARAPERLVVVVNADDLRHEGIGLSRRLSWERTAEDFVRELGSNGKLDTLVTCANLVVRFGCDGVIHHRGLSAEPPLLYFDRARAEGDFADAQGGPMLGTTAAFTAQLAATLAEPDATLDRAIRKAMTAARNVAAAGFVLARDGKPHYPHAAARVASPDKALVRVAIPAPRIAQGHAWSILDDTLGDPGNVARDVVEHGPAAALTRAPVASFGKFQTADRREIEGFRAIGNLLAEHLAQPRDKPISIGVFGPPGAGKSFGVEKVAVEVARTAARGRTVRKLEFNLSQHRSLDALTAAFHLVRDSALSGEIPLAFFDEFDSDLAGVPLGWLRFFLAPMQSGTFSEHGHDHPLGGAILIFAGGTRPRLEAFMAPMALPEGDPQHLAFKAAKGPDFVSRLRGHVDIMGPNSVDSADRTWPVRRAFVLRSLIERSYGTLVSGGRASIDPGVLHALLGVPAYSHGTRSMEAILAMSTLSGRRTLTRAALPSAGQLALHVDAADFMARVAGERLDAGLREALGQQLHDAYRDKKRLMATDSAALATDPAMKDWPDLSEDFRESSRLQADDIPRKLRAIGCFMAPAIDGRPPVSAFAPPELERLAEMEHERFNAERLRRQWRQGARNAKDRTSPFLTPWRDLAPQWQDVDRHAVRAIFDALATVDWRVYRVDGADEDRREARQPRPATPA